MRAAVAELIRMVDGARPAGQAREAAPAVRAPVAKAAAKPAAGKTTVHPAKAGIVSPKLGAAAAAQPTDAHFINE